VRRLDWPNCVLVLQGTPIGSHELAMRFSPTGLPRCLSISTFFVCSARGGTQNASRGGSSVSQAGCSAALAGTPWNPKTPVCLAEFPKFQQQSGRPGAKTVDELRQRFETLAYDS